VPVTQPVIPVLCSQLIQLSAVCCNCGFRQ